MTGQVMRLSILKGVLSISNLGELESSQVFINRDEYISCTERT